MLSIPLGGKARNIKVGGVEFKRVRMFIDGHQLTVVRSGIEADVVGKGQGTAMNQAFEEAAKILARLQGCEIVEIEVGPITNYRWLRKLRQLGYHPIDLPFPIWIKRITPSRHAGKTGSLPFRHCLRSAEDRRE
jgi:hypothetical protein